MLRAMRRACLLLILALMPLLGGCARHTAEIAICNQILPALADDAALAAPPDIAVEDDDTIVGLAFDGRIAPGDTARHRLDCRFAPGAAQPEGAALLSVALDGEALGDIRMILLRRWLGLPTPPALLAPVVAAQPLAARLAYLAQQLVNGLAVGATIALLAVGYALVYGITGTIQFAYGEIFMIGAYLSVIPFFLLGLFGLASPATLLLLVLPLAMLFTALHGWTMERVVYRPLRYAGRQPALIAAIGLALALREYVRLAQGGTDKWLPALFAGRVELFAGGGFGVLVSKTQLVMLALALAIGAILARLVARSAWGRRHRACADDPGMAALLGVDVDRTVAATFAIAAALAALAGFLVTLQYGEADPFMGFLFGFKALAAALLGGFGLLSGAVLGGLFLGLFEALWSAYFGLEYKDVAIFSMLILVLLLRPAGLLGTASPEPLRSPRA
jgi:branched-chain amino acid transport system permease protein